MKKIGTLCVCVIITICLVGGSAVAAEKVFFYHNDPAGTPLAMTDSSGNVVWRADYKPFGEEQSVTQNPENVMKFVGKEKDKESGLYYFGTRYMKDQIGRFISPDPVGTVDPKTSKTNYEMLKNPQKINRYAYAGNNPYRYIDPLGLFWEYSQTSGQLTYVDNQTEARTPITTGYSGHGEGLNNPKMEDVPGIPENEPDAGPIPTGTYDIGPAYNSKRLGPETMNLTPRSDIDTYGRDLFRIHGDNSRGDQSASHGCLVIPAKDVRKQINNSEDRELRVVE